MQKKDIKLLQTLFITAPFRVIVGGVLCVSLYMLPAGIAVLRGRKNTFAIFVFNLFLGFFIIPWVIALTWAVKSEG